mmetsp:Transcript_18520/g.61201  ORF Transcript_18520/g.61201 Transcript_18520/m.61201 type:complete len:285 (-) Transcript_18520:758-1612(-)
MTRRCSRRSASARGSRLRCEGSRAAAREEAGREEEAGWCRCRPGLWRCSRTRLRTRSARWCRAASAALRGSTPARRGRPARCACTRCTWGSPPRGRRLAAGPTCARTCSLASKSSATRRCCCSACRSTATTPRSGTRSPRLSRRRSGSDRPASCRRSSTRRTGGGSSCSGRWSSRIRPRRLPAGRACRSTRAEGPTSCPARQATTRAGARASSTTLAPRCCVSSSPPSPTSQKRTASTASASTRPRLSCTATAASASLRPTFAARATRPSSARRATWTRAGSPL